MKVLTIGLIFSLFIFNKAVSQGKDSNIITLDIDNFWSAYDKITTTTDSAQQYDYLNKLFIDKGTPGLKAIMKARDYTSKSYIDAINSYPLFWKSVRANTLKAKGLAKGIAADVGRLGELYPGVRPAKIYFTIGALKTGGTTLNDMVLIGSEVALGDKSTVTTEFPAALRHLRTFFDYNSTNLVVFTNVHEYVHTQQKTTVGDNLLAQSVIEGVAEFIAVKATGQSSVLPALGYGQANDERVKVKFALQMYNPFPGFWLYSNAANEFKVRDLGYYAGYAICETYYNKMGDKRKAIKDMINLDYNNEAALSKFVDQSGYFTKPVKSLKEQFEQARPRVINIKQFKNSDNSVDPGVTRITIEFSAPMDIRFRNFEVGPLGENNLLRVKSVQGFSEDERSLTFEVTLMPNRRYQLVVGDGFRNKDGISLKPYLIDFKTAER